MAFRGVLLQLRETESAAGFLVVAPDAELALPPRLVPGKESPLAKWSQQKLLVSDAVSKKLLQVARLATVALQGGERSVLWGATAPFPSPENRTVGAPPLTSYEDALSSGNSTRNSSNRPPVREEQAASLAAPETSSDVANTLAEMPVVPGGDTQSQRLCFCFHFRSEFEFELFAKTLAAFNRMQRYALLNTSMLIEMEIHFEQKKMKQERAKLQLAAGKSKAAKKLLADKLKKNSSKDAVTPPLQKVKRVPVTPPTKMICVLCRIQRKPDGPEYPKHPFVLKDGKGEEVHICKVCLQRVLKERMHQQQRMQKEKIELPKGSPDNYCGLCAQSTENMAPKKIKACTHDMCSRVYCIPCIDKLIGKAQAHKVWRTKNWLCPNCSTEDSDAAASSQSSGSSNAPITTTTTTKLASNPKKRKRRNEIEESTADEDTATEQEPVAGEPSADMKPLDYAVTYFKFLLGRESRGKWEESEDVCFCCKDGGDVLECDWKGMTGAFERCPKVYHEDCLGYIVPEGKKWVCPRHRCQDCGIIALYSCRFCVTSYCEDHLPRKVKRLGPATLDIPTSTYVVCPRCTQLTDDALKDKKIGRDLYSKLFRQRARNGND